MDHRHTTMTNKLFTDEPINIVSFRTDRIAEARGLRRLVAVSLIAATAFAGSALVAAGRSDAMQLNAGKTDRPAIALAYAQPMEERFGGMMGGVYQDEQAVEDHELTDAWLGMSVVSKDGVTLGYVSDAYLSEDGLTDELIVTPVENVSPLHADVALPVRLAELTSTEVSVSLTAAQAVATLVPADEFFAQEGIELAFTEN